MENTKKPNVQELIELLKANPDAFFYDIVGLPRPTPEQRAKTEKELAGLSYDEIRARYATRIAAARAKKNEEVHDGQKLS